MRDLADESVAQCLRYGGQQGQDRIMRQKCVDCGKLELTKAEDVQSHREKFGAKDSRMTGSTLATEASE